MALLEVTEQVRVLGFVFFFIVHDGRDVTARDEISEVVVVVVVFLILLPLLPLLLLVKTKPLGRCSWTPLSLFFSSILQIYPLLDSSLQIDPPSIAS